MPVLAVILLASIPVWSERNEHLEQVAERLEKAVVQKPADAKLYIHLGFVYSKLEKIDDAQRAFENAVLADPSVGKAYFMLGLIYEKKDLKEKAVWAWQSCLRYAEDEHEKETARRHLHHLQNQ